MGSDKTNRTAAPRPKSSLSTSWRLLPVSVLPHTDNKGRRRRGQSVTWKQTLGKCEVLLESNEREMLQGKSGWK